MSVAKGGVEGDAAIDADALADESEPAAAGKGGAGGKSSTKNNAAAGEKADEPPADDNDQDDKKPDDQSQAPDPGQNPPADPPAADAGATMSMPDAAVPGDAGADAARPMVDNPTGVLEDLARRSTTGRTAATINKFLETLAQGDVPAASIQEFLLAVDSEMDCKMNGFATECLAACQAVTTTCYLCVLDEPCRTTMLDICGLTALAGCVPRR